MNNKEIFLKINEILLTSSKPSKELENLINEGYFNKEPFNKIKKLNDIEQSEKYHPEGSVLKHVFLVVDLASEYKKYSNDEKV
ncbi:MAG: phosphohydrolase, partial [Romboutsia sp.]|nr:phosphohydrolase [Romboutsia sp.]